MRELFEAIDNCEAGSVNMVLTVLDGEYLGEKALVSDGKLIWESNEEGFFSKYEEAVCHMQNSGVVTIGDSRVFCDTLGQEKQLVICGGGHVSMPVIKIGIMMGWEVTVLEDRPKFADNARRAGASHVICEPFEEGLGKVPGKFRYVFCNRDPWTSGMIRCAGEDRRERTCLYRYDRKSEKNNTGQKASGRTRYG